MHSPDPFYNEKTIQIEHARDLALQAPKFLYEDEHTAHLRPQVGRTYTEKGAAAPKATSELIRLAGCSTWRPGKSSCAEGTVSIDY